MNLLTITTRYYLWLVLGLLVVCSAIFYAVLQYAVNSNIDEILYNRRNAIARTLATRQGAISPDVASYSDFSIRPQPLTQPVDTTLIYCDTLMYEPTDNEFDEYRKLTTEVSVLGKPYALTIVRTHLEADEIVGTISVTLISIFVLLTAGLLLAGRYLTRRLWTPFYQTLHRLTEFDLEASKPLQLDPVLITEFAALNRALSELTAKNYRTFQHQKQFIENASHEMQTPLAIIQAKIELLYQQPQLNQTQASLLQALDTEADRLSRLNKALLLLSQIDNRQFADRTRVVWVEIAERVLPYFDEQAEKKRLCVELDIAPDAHVHTSSVLADILLTNLLKNAFVHNIPDGVVRVATMGRTLIVENTGDVPTVPPEELFGRFRKASRQKQTLGLGLAIVKSIVDANGWQVRYTYQDKVHRVTVSY